MGRACSAIISLRVASPSVRVSQRGQVFLNGGRAKRNPPIRRLVVTDVQHSRIRFRDSLRVRIGVSMVTPIQTVETSSLTKRPLGIIVAESYFVTFLVFGTFRLIADLDVFTRMASRLNLHFFQFFAGSTSEPIFCVLSVFALVGLQRMRRWGRWLAIVLAGVQAGCRDLVLFGRFDFSAVDIGSASPVAVRNEVN
jgi:hypothetical protein